MPRHSSIFSSSLTAPLLGSASPALRLLLWKSLALLALLGITAHLRARLLIRQGALEGRDALQHRQEEVYYRALAASRKRVPGVRKVILGDSVAGMTYPPDRYCGEVYSLTAYAPATLAASYFLLRNFLSANPDAGPEVYLLVVPPALLAEADVRLTYSHFLKPFFTPENLPEVSPALQARCQQIAFSEFCQVPVLKLSDWSPVFFLPAGQQDPVPAFYFSETNLEYLQKIVALCNERHLSFHFRSLVVRESFRRLSYEPARRQAERTGLSGLVEAYLDSVEYRPDRDFADLVHPAQRWFRPDWLNLGPP